MIFDRNVFCVSKNRIAMCYILADLVEKETKVVTTKITGNCTHCDWLRTGIIFLHHMNMFIDTKSKSKCDLG